MWFYTVICTISFSVMDLSSPLPSLVLNQGIHLCPYWLVSVLTDFFSYDINICRYPQIFFLFFCLLSSFYGGYSHVKILKWCEFTWSIIFFLALLLWLMFLKRILLSYSLFSLLLFLFSLFTPLPTVVQGLGETWEAWSRLRSGMFYLFFSLVWLIYCFGIWLFSNLCAFDF